jgi:CRISPR/Cas system endoribonuclease Cas6 (RAMP superfamily)
MVLGEIFHKVTGNLLRGLGKSLDVIGKGFEIRGIPETCKENRITDFTLFYYFMCYSL